jgi:hypothetical protein
VRENILDQYPSAHLQVMVVWFNMLHGDTRALTDLQVLNDKRVTNFWDERKMLGGWYGDHLEGGGIAWDVYFLYGPDARWSGGSNGPLGRGGPVVAAGNDLRTAMRPFLGS